MDDKEEILSPSVQEEMKRLSRVWMFGDQKRKIKKFHILNKDADKGGVVFVGDSITESYPIHELLQVDTPIFNRGISGYTSLQMKKNLAKMVLDLEPSIVFLLIGTNDIEFGITPEQTAKNIQYISMQIRDVVLHAIVYVVKVYPVNENFVDSIGNRSNRDIDTINSLVNQYTLDIDRVECLDLSNVLAEDGNLRADFTHDGLHLNMFGYKAVTEVLRKYIK